MTVREFYDVIGGDHAEAVGRLMTEGLVTKFVLKFRDDPNFAALKEAVAKEQWEEAFGFAHTLKGVALNLAFARLSRAAVELTDALRPQNRESFDPLTGKALFDRVAEEYAAVCAAIGDLSAEG